MRGERQREAALADGVRQLDDEKHHWQKACGYLKQETDGLEMQDDHHFDMLGHQVWGGRVIDDMKMMGWFPWTK